MGELGDLRDVFLSFAQTLNNPQLALFPLSI